MQPAICRHHRWNDQFFRAGRRLMNGKAQLAVAVSPDQKALVGLSEGDEFRAGTQGIALDPGLNRRLIQVAEDVCRQAGVLAISSQLQNAIRPALECRRRLASDDPQIDACKRIAHRNLDPLAVRKQDRAVGSGCAYAVNIWRWNLESIIAL